MTITGVSLGSTSTVKFKMVDQNGNGFSGLPLSSVSLTLAQLVPGTNGDDNYWQDYFNTVAKPGVGPGTASTVVATNDSGGSLVDNKDGTYVYTLGTDITKVTSPITVTYNPTLTHRVAIAMSADSFPVPITETQMSNAVYDFQPSTGNTTGITTQNMVDTTTCNSCHDHLGAHGGFRQDPRLCVTCHNPGPASNPNVEPNSGNTLDFKVMLHKLHDAANLPSVKAGTPYYFIGFGNRKHDFSAVVFPQSVENCSKCHDPSNKNTPDAGLYATAPSLQACGSCHDDVNFSQGAAGGHAGGVVTDNSQCTVCHAANRVAGSVDQSHTIIGKADAAKFQYNIISVSNTAPGQKPVVKFSVTNPSNNNSFYNLGTDPSWTASGGASRLGIDLAWSTTDYENAGSGSYPGQPVAINALKATANGDGTYTATSTVAVPAGATGSGAVAIEGHPADTTQNPVLRVPVTSAVSYFSITDSQPVARREIVSAANCENCHGQNDGLSFHGNNRTDQPQLCAMCHNPDATDLSQRPTDPDGTVNGVNTAAVDGLEQRTIDFKYFIHAIHAAGMRNNSYVVYGFGGSHNDFSGILFSGIINNCAECHVGSSYMPPLASTDLGTTTNTKATVVKNACPASPGAVNYAPCGAIQNNALYGRTSPTASVCSACHDDSASLAHMGQNGGTAVPYPGITTAEMGATPATSESCAVCHGAGAVADVAVVHGVH